MECWPLSREGWSIEAGGSLLQLYRVLVRPHLEYCAQFCSPYLRKDILALEGVHQVDSGDEGLTYEERLSRLGLLLIGV